MNRAAQLLKALMDHVKGFRGKNLFKARILYNRLQITLK